MGTIAICLLFVLLIFPLAAVMGRIFIGKHTEIHTVGLPILVGLIMLISLLASIVTCGKTVFLPVALFFLLPVVGKPESTLADSAPGFLDKRDTSDCFAELGNDSFPGFFHCDPFGKQPLPLSGLYFLWEVGELPNGNRV